MIADETAPNKSLVCDAPAYRPTRPTAQPLDEIGKISDKK